MSLYQFAPGARLEYKGDVYKLFHRNRDGAVVLEPIGGGRERVIDRHELQRAYRDGELAFLDEGRKIDGDPDAPAPDAASAGKRLRDIGEYLTEHVEAGRFKDHVLQPLIVAYGAGEWSREAVMQRIDEVRKEIKDRKKVEDGRVMAQPPGCGLSITSVYRWRDEWLRYDGDWRGLIPARDPRHDTLGGKGATRLKFGIDRIVTAVIMDKCFQGKKVRKVRREKVTLKTLHDAVALRIYGDKETGRDGDAEVLRLIEQEHARERLLAAQEGRRPKLPSYIPSESTVGRFKAQLLSHRERYIAEHGQEATERHFRQYGEGVTLTRPLQRAEIDLTRIDVLVLDDDGTTTIGRLTLAVMVDCLTRYPLGYYLGWEEESYLAVMHCLMHAALPKDGLKEFYGSRNEWRAWGLPEVLVVDNGAAFANQSLKDVLATLKIDLQYRPPGKPWYAGIVERLFGSLNTSLFHQMPGRTMPPEARRHAGYDSAAEAIYKASQVDKELFIYLVDEYAEEEHGGLDNDLPARAWDRECALAAEEGWEPRVPKSAAKLRITLCSVHPRVVLHYGIDFFHLRYNVADDDKVAKAELAELRARQEEKPKGERQLKIKVDHGDLSRVYLHDPYHPTDPEHYITLYPIRRHWDRCQHLSLWQWHVIRKAEIANRKRRDAAALGAVKEDRSERRDAAKEGKARTDRARRASERAATRGQQIRDVTIAANAAQTGVIPPLVPVGAGGESPLALPPRAVPPPRKVRPLFGLAALHADIAAEETNYRPERIRGT